MVQEMLQESLKSQQLLKTPLTQYAVMMTPETGQHLRRIKSLEDQLAIYCMLNNLNPEDINETKADEIIQFIEDENFD
jgi:hypothetical protein